jgi:CBS domain-containing protein
MQVGELMSRECRIVKADDTIEQAARIMADEDVGILPVAENDRLVGMISDRDIVTRCVAQGCERGTRVREAMTRNVKYCFEYADLDETLDNMAEIQVHRLPVMSREKRLVGIISLGDAARRYSPNAAGQAYSGVVSELH